MKIHEYQAKKLFSKFSIPIPEGKAVNSSAKAEKIAMSSNTFPMVVKAQIHAGGRGKGGGVKIAHSIDEVRTYAEEILGMTLVTHQTGPEGKLVRKVLIEKCLDIDRELYLSIIPDRKSAQIVIMASKAGGMDIEEVAEKTPEKIIRVSIDPLMGIQSYHCREIMYRLEIPKKAMKQFTHMLTMLFELFTHYDCSLVEINPLVITKQEATVALDAKVDIDDNALYRHPDIKKFRDLHEEHPLEVEASKYHLNYISFDGNIGTIVNGAGLAMATMDIIKTAGAAPANFLDIGGGATEEMVENALRIILMDTNVKGILFNVFGGILRCDIFARGVVKAAIKTNVKLPVVIRMEGTNVEEARRILYRSPLNMIAAVDIKDAAQKVAQITSKWRN